jgi:hypothetical protein
VAQYTLEAPLPAGDAILTNTGAFREAPGNEV